MGCVTHWSHVNGRGSCLRTTALHPEHLTLKFVVPVKFLSGVPHVHKKHSVCLLLLVTNFLSHREQELGSQADKPTKSVKFILPPVLTQLPPAQKLFPPTQHVLSYGNREV